MPAQTPLLSEDQDQDQNQTRNTEFVKIMHGKSAEQRNAFMSMLKKDGQAHRIITDEYVKRWEEDPTTDDDTVGREKRKSEYMSLVNNYYDLATDLYEEGWAQSFHFCRFALNEPLLKALARHEHYLAHMLDIKPHMTVLDVGCGVGGPAREIATFTGCKVVGLNNNGYQIERAGRYAQKEGLGERVSFVKGDFMNINFPPNTFDAIYAIEATCHAPTLEGVYSQIYRVLKPGGRFGVYEWVMTSKYNANDSRHRALKLGIERGDGIANMVTISEAIAAMKSAGFILEHEDDLAGPEHGDLVSWYSPLSGEFKNAKTISEIFGALRLSWLGRTAMRWFLRGLEVVRLAPSGTAETADELGLAARSLVEGGKEGLFTPMFFMIARKPEA